MKKIVKLYLKKLLFAILFISSFKLFLFFLIFFHVYLIKLYFIY